MTPGSKRRVRAIVFIALAGMVASVAAFAPYEADRRANGVFTPRPAPPSPAAARLHQSLVVADLHADTLLWNRDLTKTHKHGHIDLPRLLEGNVALQAFSVVTKAPHGLNVEKNSGDSDQVTLLSIAQGMAPATWRSLLARATAQAERLRALEVASEGRFQVIDSAAALRAYLARRAADPRRSAGWLTLEGAHALEGKLDNLDVLYRAGFRMAAPTHFFDTELSGSQHGERKGGLTELGRAWVAGMEQRSMIIDLAHASDATFEQVLAMATRPVIVSHTGLRGTCPGRRNLSDDQLRAVARGGGLVGIGFWPTAVCGKDVKAIARAIAYAVKTVGERHVAYGSDFDGAVSTPLDAAGLAALTQALLDAGLTPEQIRRVAGENTIEFLLKNLPASSG